MSHLANRIELATAMIPMANHGHVMSAAPGMRRNAIAPSSQTTAAATTLTAMNKALTAMKASAVRTAQYRSVHG